MSLPLSILIPALFSVGPYAPCDVTGEPTTLSRTYAVQGKPDFKKTVPSKELLQIEYSVEDYKVCVQGEYVYGTRFFANYTVTERKHLEKYAFVQYIRGFVYEINTGNGLRTNTLIVHRHHSGIMDDLWHDRWTVDTDNPDPIYTSSFGYSSRFQILHWNRSQNSFEYSTEESHAEKHSPYNHAYIWDRPAQAFVNNASHARNVSLEFRTCIYNTKDIPKRTKPEKEAEFIHDMKDKALNCYDWNTSWSFNTQTQEYERLEEIAVPPPLAPEYQ